MRHLGALILALLALAWTSSPLTAAGKRLSSAALVRVLVEKVLRAVARAAAVLRHLSHFAQSEDCARIDLILHMPRRG